jgi:membrane-bound lytic murein transglycosylase B
MFGPHTISLKKASLVLVCALLLLPPLSVRGEDDDDDSAVDRYRQELQKKLDATMKEISGLQVFYNQKSQERQSLERDIALLDAQIKQSQLSIKARNIAIQQLGGEIGQRGNTIVALDEKLGRQKASLAELLRTTNQIDDYSLVEVALSKENVSEFFKDLDSFDSINNAIQGSFRDIAVTRTTTENEKKILEEKRGQEVEFKNLQELEKQKIELQEQQKHQVLTVTKGQEGLYQQMIVQKEQTAAQIRAELFKLRDSSAISLGDAVDFAKLASAKTGVRAALILGTLQQETKLGDFLGTGNWKTDSHPVRDQWIFKILMDDLGLDPDAMPVSKAPSYGYGGAMGPAQFIPSTWVLYAGYACSAATQSCTYNKDKDIIGSLTGNHPPNPYNPADAFMASALLLRDNGAAAGTPAAEREAVLRYFAGGNWSNPSYAFYGNEVTKFADGYQHQIDILNKSN